MTNILKKLQYLDFPQSSKEALKYLVQCCSESSHQGIPGLGGINENLAGEVAQEYILNMSRGRRGHNTRRLNAIHELQLLEMICSSLQEAPEQSRYNIFSAIFGGHIDIVKINLLSKMVSMAISISCAAVLGCAALWMQEQGSQSQAVCDLAQRLVDDYCLLYPSVSSTFQKLPKVSSLFTCNFVTALTTIYTYTDANKSPPLCLLECIVEWISSDPCLCSDSVRLIRIRSNFTCPVSGLVRWCVLGPLVTLIKSCSTTLVKQESSKSLAISPGLSPQKSVSDIKQSEDVTSKLLTLFSKLHLGILMSLQAYKSMELNQELFSFGDLYILAKVLHTYFIKGHKSEQVGLAFCTCVDRLAQVIQVSLQTRSLHGNFDIKKISELLPPNRLLQLIAGGTPGRRTEPMELGV